MIFFQVLALYLAAGLAVALLFALFGAARALPERAPVSAGARLLLIAGQPLREPIAQHGPFVMNTREELMQAVQDYQYGRLGTVRA